jgi:hypothetical protein
VSRPAPAHYYLCHAAICQLRYFLSFVMSAVDGLFIILSGAAPVGDDALESDFIAGDGVLDDELDEDVDASGLDELEDDGDAPGLDELDDEDEDGGVLGLIDELDDELVDGVDGGVVVVVLDDDVDGDGVTTGGVVDVEVFVSR